MTENTIITFGKHKGKYIKDLPNSYLKWAVENKALSGDALVYAEQRVGYKDYAVNVKGAAIGNGDYVVRALSKRDAVKVAEQTNLIVYSNDETTLTVSTHKP